MSSGTPPYATPNVSPLYYRNHKYGFIGTLVSLMLYGVAATLFVLCLDVDIRLLKKCGKGNDNVWMKRLLLLYICSLFTCGTAQIVASACVTTISTLDYSNYPGGTYAWAMTQYNKPLFKTGPVAFGIANWLANGLMFYRCYVIYVHSNTRGAIYILVLPCVLYIASVCTQIAFVAQLTSPDSNIFALPNLAKLILSNFAINASLNGVT
ncbi:hypothetical protein DFP72DRAFT_1176835 [Ephemerocybe angulata]|uniref:Uncharacterized protein n=1 Tax=Ephemerocybe angulata TaxID=980116 RepID=A0A8H6HF16_9AGAR|nr:hypothetical protein DFP72DRAFT_1176835 [Tulosesus angulatus]